MDHVTTDDLELFKLGHVTDALAIAEIGDTSQNVTIALTACWR
jgi:putative Ca2+/H+ antiporter (TMEM165/GDT1 family)